MRMLSASSKLILVLLALSNGTVLKCAKLSGFMSDARSGAVSFVDVLHLIPPPFMRLGKASSPPNVSTL